MEQGATRAGFDRGTRTDEGLMRAWIMILGTLAGLFGAAGVALAAVGAHLTAAPSVTTAAYFLLFHAAALLGVCALAAPRPDRTILAGGAIIALGAILFSGDLALRALAHVTLVRLAAPTGGILLILGWLVLAVAIPFRLGGRH